VIKHEPNEISHAYRLYTAKFILPAFVYLLRVQKDTEKYFQDTSDRIGSKHLKGVRE